MGEAKDELKKVITLVTDNPWSKEIMEGWPRTVLFELKGEEIPFHIIVRDGKMSLREGVPDEVDVLVRGQGSELARVVRRERDITHPIAEASLTVEKGSLSQMIILDRILATAKRKR